MCPTSRSSFRQSAHPHPRNPSSLSPTSKCPALPRPAMKLSAAVLSATLVALAGGVAAQLAVLAPGGPNLWMSKSLNSLARTLIERAC